MTCASTENTKYSKGETDALIEPISGGDEHDTKEKRKEGKTRRAVLRYIRESPGAYFTEIRRALGLSAGAITHHTRKLEREEMIKSRKKGCRKHFYSRDVRIEECHFTERQKEIMEAIAVHPAISTLKLAAVFETTRQAMSYHVNNLRDLGAIKSRKEKRRPDNIP